MLAGCTANYYRKSADKVAYGVVRQKAKAVPNMDPNFTIERTNALSLDRLPQATSLVEALGPDGEKERGARVLKLDDALGIAVWHSRAYQTRKEDLFMSALRAKMVQHQFTPIFSGNASGEFTDVVTEITRTNGLGTNATVSLALVDDYRGRGGAAVNAQWLMRDVGRLTAAFTTDFVRFVTGDPRASRSSQLTFEFTRPLWRDAGYKAQVEALTQSERNMLYQLRDFTRYRREFSVSIATAYFGVLGNRDTVRNNYLNLQSSRKNAERSRALAEEGRERQSSLGRLEQQELSSEGAWINAIRAYQQSLDNFKMLLGLSVDENILLDDQELAALKIQHPEISVEDSIQVALGARLDYLNSKDALEDSERHVKLAANFLKPRLDFSSGITFRNSPDEVNGVALPDFSRYSYSAGLNLDPLFDRTSERDDYRSRLIERDRAVRAIEQQEDEIKLQVRNSWRTLDQAKRSYEISEIGVRLAERRVEEQNLLAELGRAQAQDQVDAQNDLVSSRNQRTQALVAHTIARLQFWNNMGILYIKDNGQWEEVQDSGTGVQPVGGSAGTPSASSRPAFQPVPPAQDRNPAGLPTR
jgi:outer membrane protein TolC